MNRIYFKANNFINLQKLFTGFVVCVMFALALPVQAQTANQKETVTAQPAATGTYQLIFNSKREDKDIKLTNRELSWIEQMRKDNEVVYARATYSDDIRIKILPRNTVNGKSFAPVPLKYYKDEHNYEEYSQIRYVDLQ